MAQKTISLPDDVVPIIDRLGMPFSHWVADQLRRHAGRSEPTFVEQLEADAAMSGAAPPTEADATATGERMQRSAPW